MDRNPSRGDQRGVSPVIGVILMVAITVLLAATAASLFLGIQDDTLRQKSPTVVLDHKYDADGSSDRLKITHTGGDELETNSLNVVVSNAECGGAHNPNQRYTLGALGYSESEVTAGASFSMSDSHCAGTDLDLSEATVSVVWLGQHGSKSNTLWRWDGPKA